MINFKGKQILHRLLLGVFFALAALMGPYNAFGAEASDSLEAVSDIQADEYLIGTEDVLEISVWKNPDLSKTVIVLPDGMISLPLIGDVRAAGLTPYQLKMSITERLKKYQQTAVVSVIVEEFNSYKVFMLGEVMHPGPLLIKRRITLLQAIAMAGGFNQFASKNKILVIREGLDENGREEKIVVRFSDIVNVKKNSNSNLVLRSGDTVFVP